MANSPVTSKTTLVTFAISLAGSPIDESYQVRNIEVYKEVNRIATARFTIIDGSPSLQDFVISDKDDFKPGVAVKIEAGYQSTNATIFEGVITKHGIRIGGSKGSELVVECKDKAVKMTVGRNNAYYAKKKDSDIISTLIGNSGATASVPKPTSLEHKNLVQYYCTDWDFMLSRAEANGMIALVDDGTVTVQAPDVSGTAVISLTFGKDIIEFHAEMDARTQLSATKGTTWDMSQQAIVQVDGADPTINSVGDIDSSTLADVLGVTTYNLQSSGQVQEADMQAWADAQMQKSWLSRISGSAKFQGNATVKPGTIIEVAGVGTRFNGDVFIRTIRHEINGGNWVTNVEFGLSHKWFYEMPNIMAPPAGGILPGIPGLQIAVVKQLDEDPDGETRILVTFPMMQDDANGIWARLTTFYATNTAGCFFIPEIGDEVVIGFLNGDPRYAIILGSMYSSKNAPPYDPTADNYTKAFVTKAQLQIIFDDENKVITAQTPGGNSIVISDEDKGITATDQNGNSITMNDSGIVIKSASDMSLEADGDITIKAGGASSFESKDATTIKSSTADVNVTATGKVAIKATQDATIDGLNVTATANVGATLKGNATAELSASGQTTVKGAMVMIN